MCGLCTNTSSADLCSTDSCSFPSPTSPSHSETIDTPKDCVLFLHDPACRMDIVQEILILIFIQLLYAYCFHPTHSHLIFGPSARNANPQPAISIATLSPLNSTMSHLCPLSSTLEKLCETHTHSQSHTYRLPCNCEQPIYTRTHTFWANWFGCEFASKLGKA